MTPPAARHRGRHPGKGAGLCIHILAALVMWAWEKLMPVPAQNDIDPRQALWITREVMLDVFAGQHPLILPPRKGAIAGFLLRNWVADRLD